MTTWFWLLSGGLGAFLIGSVIGIVSDLADSASRMLEFPQPEHKD